MTVHKKRWVTGIVVMLCVMVSCLTLLAFRRDHRLPYKDHFGEGRMDEWMAFGGAWQIVNGSILNDSDDIGAKLITGSRTLQNYRITSDIRLTNDFGDAGVIVRVRNAEEGANAFDGYYAGIRLPNQLLVGKMDFGFRPMARVLLRERVRPGIWYRLSVEVKGCTVTAIARTADGSLLASASTIDTESCDTHGAFGLRSFEAGGSWRNIRVEVLP